ncbi:hypothetical protein [Candidatus Albibeggiatoa sp. nov. NOAA]|uniref:hypothetical protein n=1 Tax=Candidatus Albibeggiatoa sp. nov. NOAA TaxID=3162724 RepID=UPI0032FE675B|nr:hypothetical protein [Thiotrichaceae bacterium]
MSTHLEHHFAIYWSYATGDPDENREITAIKNYIITEILKGDYIERDIFKNGEYSYTNTEESISLSKVKVIENLEKTLVLVIIITDSYNTIEYDGNEQNGCEIDFFLGLRSSLSQEYINRAKDVFVFAAKNYRDWVDVEMAHYNFNFIYFETGENSSFKILPDSIDKAKYLVNSLRNKQIPNKNHYQILIDNLSENELYFEKVIENIEDTIRDVSPQKTDIYRFKRINQRVGNLARSIERTDVQVIVYSCHSQMDILSTRLQIYKKYSKSTVCVFFFVYGLPEYNIDIDGKFFDCYKGINSPSCCKIFVEQCLLGIKGQDKNDCDE